DAIARGAQGCAGLRAGIVEFAGLADDDGPGADDHDRMDIYALRHSTSSPGMVDDRLIKTIPLFRVRVLSHVVLSARSIESTEPAIKTVEIVLARTHAPRNRFTCEIRKRL